jgi:uncharacterized membrane protein YfbV (UPF0208 family)
MEVLLSKGDGMVSMLAMTDALTKLVVEKRLITHAEFSQKLLEERAVYQRILTRQLNEWFSPELGPAICGARLPFRFYRESLNATESIISLPSKRSRACMSCTHLRTTLHPYRQPLA